MKQNIRYLLQNATLQNDESSALPLAGLCEELEAMAGHNFLEYLSFDYNPEYGEGTGQNLGGLH